MSGHCSVPLYAMGVDGGGSRTLAVILDGQGAELGRGQGGPSNHQSVGVEAARQGLREAVVAARAAAGHPVLSAACLGMAGLDRAGDEDILDEMAAAVLPDVPFEIVHDATIALVGGTSGRRIGVVIIAGTGSIAVGFDAAGRTSRAGGWGHLLGDEGSGYDLARRGLNAATRARDGRGPTTLLTEWLPAAAGVDSLEVLADRIYLEGWTAPQVAALAPVVLAAAQDGDPAALEIVARAADELGQAATAVIAALGFEQTEFEVVLSGGIFQGSPHLVHWLRGFVLKRAPRAQVHLPRHDPAWGAAWMALERARGTSPGVG